MIIVKPTYDDVKKCWLGYEKRNRHRSFHDFDDPDHRSVEQMGEAAAPHLFRLMFEENGAATHFCYNLIPLLIKPPPSIVTKMNEQALERVGGFVAMKVNLMEEIYKEWGIEIGALPKE